MSGPTPLEYAARRATERRRVGRMAFVGLALSAAVHFFALVFIDVPLRLNPDRIIPPPIRTVNIVPVMQVYEIVPVAGDVAAIADQVRLRVPTSEDAVETQPQWAPVAPPADAPPAPSRADPVYERLEYRMGAAQLWRPPPPLGLSADEAARNRVADRIAEVNDSLAGEAARRAKVGDWTVRDGSGGRWGVTPDAIHLGGVTIPIPVDVELRPPPGRREEIAGRIRTWAEVQDQAMRVEGRQIFDDRVKAIRERLEKERAKQAGGGGG